MNALTSEMATLAQANVNDHGVMFPVQQFVVVVEAMTGPFDCVALP